MKFLVKTLVGVPPGARSHELVAEPPFPLCLSHALDLLEVLLHLVEGGPPDPSYRSLPDSVFGVRLKKLYLLVNALRQFEQPHLLEERGIGDSCEEFALDQWASKN